MKKAHLFIIGYCLSFLLNGSLAHATSTDTTQSQNLNDQTTIKSQIWNLQDADILSVINEVALETGKNFIVDPRVNGKISLVSSKPIKPSEVYDLFLSILELLGYSAIPNGNVVKIVPNIDSNEYAAPLAKGQTIHPNAEVMVQVIPVENLAANQLIPIIRPLLPQWNNVSVYSPGNVLIIYGRAANLQRIKEMIQQIDKSGGQNIEVINLHNTSATQLAAVINNLQTAGRANGEAPQIILAPDERSNSLIISGTQTARLHTRMLITQLDKPQAGNQGNTQVVYLRYLQAKNFAPILGKIAQNILGKGTSNAAENAANTSARQANENQTPANTTNIQAEPSTNSLIITAPPQLMASLTAIIAKLDIRPAQVLVEGIIVEIGEEDLKNLGIQWGSLTSNSNVSSSSTTNFNFMPLGLGAVGIIPGEQIQAILGILQNKSGVDILSTPSLVVLDNQQASLAVGTQVPDQTGSYATTGNTSTVNPFNTINRLNVDLKLKVTPQINLGNAVRLTIALNNDSLKNPEDPGLNPITNTSEIKNSVIVDSQDVLVLGGLISNNVTDITEKVPILGDVPLLGVLFQHKVRKLEKRNLVVFIKPTILHSSDDSTMITNTKYNMVRNTQINWPDDLGSEGKQKLNNILPPLNKADIPKPFNDN